MTQLELINNWLERYEHDEVALTPEGLMELLKSENGECADIVENHHPARFRGGYADGLIEGNPMLDIGKEIRERQA
jgi:hypothetical protein